MFIHLSAKEHFPVALSPNFSTLSCYHCQRKITNYVTVPTVHFNYYLFMYIRGSNKEPQSLYAPPLLYLVLCSIVFFPLCRKMAIITFLYYIIIVHYIMHQNPVMRNLCCIFLCTAHALILKIKTSTLKASPW